MLEVKNLTFQVNENGIERSIVENISFNVEARWLLECVTDSGFCPVVDIIITDIGSV